MDTIEDNLADKPKIRQKHFAKQFGLQNKLPIFVTEPERVAFEEYVEALKTYIIK